MIPKELKFIENIGVLPKIVSAGMQYLGVKEIPGVKNNPVIMDMAAGLGVSKIYTNDDQSWCAVFINHLIRITGKPIDLNPKDKYDLLRARRTATLWNNIDADNWALGDIVIIKREGGGHVFLPIAETPNKTIWGLGGNQSNMVKFSEFAKSRILAVKRFYKVAPPESAKQYFVNSAGELSVNES